jgi:hypothetical protein
MNDSDRKAERERLAQAARGERPWKKWGPYLSERQWGTVRENATPGIEAWNEVGHDQARSRAYLSGEDGLAGFCDDQMLLCFSVALWNGRDPILKERLFGLTNSEGNHGEDVKEYYFYLDSAPTHSYAKMLYKYPQAPFPYDQLVAENRRRSRNELEFELMDTGVFDEDRYWDVFVEMAKGDPEDLLFRISAVNRGPAPARLCVLPHLWFRHTWSRAGADLPVLEARSDYACPVVFARHKDLGARFLYCEGASELLFTDNETNRYRLFGEPNVAPHQKDGINDCVVNGRRDAVNPGQRGTKSAARYLHTVGPGETWSIRLRLVELPPGDIGDAFAGFDRTFAERIRETDDFYDDVIAPSLSADAKQVVRQGYAGLLWTKQAYVYDVDGWLTEHGVTRGSSDQVRNQHWFHMYSADIISMPDKWEYPWFATWDLAFHAIAFSAIDPDFARGQLDLMTLDRYQHPNGQLPAYEWNFDDVNPPVHAWATMFTYRFHREAHGDEALAFLKRSFHMLMSNFTWWMNRKDREGRNLYEGGFLGLDNIGVFDRSAPLPTGGYLEQADGTAWMAFFAQNMLDMALELALHDSAYETLAVRFYEQVIRIAHATNRTGDREALWDDEDGFFYDVLRVPGQWTTRIKVRSIVGLLPLCAVTVFRPEVLAKVPRFVERVRWFNVHRPELLSNLHQPAKPGAGGRLMLSMLNDDKLRRVLARMLDPHEFLGDHGIRSLSRHHLDHPYVFRAGGQEYSVRYLPAESDTGMFGGNSNWRGPIWAPINSLLIRALLHMYSYYGDDFRVECPTGSGHQMTLYEVAQELSNRMASIFLLDHRGRRPVYGETRKFADDPHFRDHILFYEYFHGDNGAGLGASHQTGWTAAIPTLMQIFARLSPEAVRARDTTIAELVGDRPAAPAPAAASG